MSDAAVNGLFTLGVPPERYRLPHDKIDLAVILLVRKVLLRAFETICERGFSLATKKEDEIKSYELGCNFFLNKPSKMSGYEMLTQLVKKFINKEPSQ